MARKKSGFVVIIAGPTGVGESTITKELLKIFPQAKRLVTTTTRPKRPGEVHGRDYFFIDKKTFKKQIKEKKFLEYSYIKNRDQYYGSKKSDFDKILNAGKIIFFNCDKAGLKAVKKTYPRNHLSIFITYEKLSDIKKRLLTRNPNLNPDELKKRLINARTENQEKHFYDYIIINRQGQLKKTVKRAEKIILKHLTLANP